MKKIPAVKYFKNLDGLRFFAAFAVIIGHCQHVIFQYQGYQAYEPYANKLASFGVDFFFVLSGFLISNLLIVEIEKTGSINIRHFYYRRFLRIWPLYFLVGLIGLCTGQYWLKWFDYLTLFDGQYSDYVYNWKDFFYNLLFLGTFSSNFQALLGYHNPVSSLAVGHFWSLAIEEQFYLLWAPAMYLLRRHIWAVILLFLSIGFYFNQLPASQFSAYTSFQYNFTANRFWYFGLGAAFALWIRYFSIEMVWEAFQNKIKMTKLPPSVFQVILSRKTLILTILTIQLVLLIPALNYLFGTKFYTNNSERVVDAYVALLIIVIAIADYSVLSILFLESKVFKYLGKISYGIYIFHIFSIYLTYKILKNIGLIENSTLFYILCPVVSTGIAVILATLSYEFFEKYFLKLKHKFS